MKNGPSETWGGQFGHIYVNSQDSGQLDIWYFEFRKGNENNWNAIKSCMQSNDIDDCAKQHATNWYSGVPISSSCATMESKMAGAYTCGGRINYLMKTDHKSWTDAYQQVNGEYPSICTCDPSQKETTTPYPKPNPTTSNPRTTKSPQPNPSSSCTEMKTKKAGQYTCGQRMDYEMTTK